MRAGGVGCSLAAWFREHSPVNRIVFQPPDRSGWLYPWLSAQRVDAPCSSGAAPAPCILIGGNPEDSQCSTDVIVVYCHGNAGDVVNNTPYCELLSESGGFEVLMVEYPGYSIASVAADGSPASPSFDGVNRHAVAAARWALRRVGGDAARLVLCGRSLGSGPACHAAETLAEQDGAAPLALLLHSPMLTFKATVRVKARLLGRLATERWDNLQACRATNRPVLIVHGELDDIIPIEHGRQLASGLQRARLVEVKGRDHHDMTEEETIEPFIQFVQSCRRGDAVTQYGKNDAIGEGDGVPGAEDWDGAHDGLTAATDDAGGGASMPILLGVTPSDNEEWASAAAAPLHSPQPPSAAPGGALPLTEARPDVLVVGGGPVGLWTALQLKARCPSMGVLLFERNLAYGRHHVLRLDMVPIRAGAAPAAAVQEFCRSLPSAVSTSDLEASLRTAAAQLGVCIEQRVVASVDGLLDAYPSAAVLIGADGSRSVVRRQVFGTGSADSSSPAAATADDAAALKARPMESRSHAGNVSARRRERAEARARHRHGARRGLWRDASPLVSLRAGGMATTGAANEPAGSTDEGSGSGERVGSASVDNRGDPLQSPGPEARVPNRDERERLLRAQGLSLQQTLQHVALVRYQAMGDGARRLRFLDEALPTLLQGAHLIDEHVGRPHRRQRADHVGAFAAGAGQDSTPAAPCRPVTLQVLLNRNEHIALKSATFADPITTLDDPRMLASPALQGDILSWLRARGNHTGETLRDGTLSVTALSLSVYRASGFVHALDTRAGNRVAVVLCGDAAFGVPFFRSLNAGMLCANELAAALAAAWDARGERNRAATSATSQAANANGAAPPVGTAADAPTARPGLPTCEPDSGTWALKPAYVSRSRFEAERARVAAALSMSPKSGVAAALASGTALSQGMLAGTKNSIVTALAGGLSLSLSSGISDRLAPQITTLSHGAVRAFAASELHWYADCVGTIARTEIMKALAKRYLVGFVKLAKMVASATSANAHLNGASRIDPRPNTTPMSQVVIEPRDVAVEPVPDEPQDGTVGQKGEAHGVLPAPPDC